MARKRSRRGYQPNVGPERQTSSRQRRRRRRQPLGVQLIVLLAFLFLTAAVAAAVYFLIANPDGVSVGMFGNEEPVEDDAPVADGADDESAVVTTIEPTVSSTTEEPTTSLGTTSTLSAPSVTGVPIEGTLSDGRVSLRGAVPDLAIGEQFIALIEGFVGEGNVDQLFTLDTGAPVPNSFILRVIDNILFAAGGDSINPEFFPFLDQLVEFMRIDPNITLIIEGHTDSTGNPVDNLALSQRRAEAVRTYVAEQGINEFRLEAKGRGSTEPVASEDTADGRNQNRRIEFELVGFQIESP